MPTGSLGLIGISENGLDLRRKESGRAFFVLVFWCGFSMSGDRCSE